jgi:hypothetical protein
MIYLNTLHDAITKGKYMKQLLTNIGISNIMFKNISNYIIFLNSLIAGFELSVPVIARQKGTTDSGSRFHCRHGKHSPNYVGNASWKTLVVIFTVIRTKNLTMKDNLQTIMHYFATGST